MPGPLIVVVDDEQSMLDLFSDILEDEGYRVVTCMTREEAIVCVTRDLPDVVILDLWLETSTGGWDVCAALAREPRTATIPIILCSATDANGRLQPEGLEPCCLSFLDKPFEIGQLLTAVETALRSQSAIGGSPAAL
jgi:two-component system phosphate regulon response regulator PhoB